LATSSGNMARLRFRWCGDEHQRPDRPEAPQEGHRGGETAMCL